MVQASGSIVFPQDVGTGIATREDADFTSAGHFAGLVAKSEYADYVEVGLEFRNVDNGDFDIGAGLVFLGYESALDVQDEQSDYSRTWDQGAVFVVHVQETVGISYTTGSLNHVFVSADIGINNDVEYVVNTTGDVPASPSLKIGEIDAAESPTELNRDSPIEKHRKNEVHDARQPAANHDHSGDAGDTLRPNTLIVPDSFL